MSAPEDQWVSYMETLYLFHEGHVLTAEDVAATREFVHRARMTSTHNAMLVTQMEADERTGTAMASALLGELVELGEAKQTNAATAGENERHLASLVRLQNVLTEHMPGPPLPRYYWEPPVGPTGVDPAVE